ncbi:protein-tyrosine phosphatase-like protein [Sporodiniella umbellata]|nr:protein-tyrosine phosphatase-like protein [Sporodiniella umbellata]
MMPPNSGLASRRKNLMKKNLSLSLNGAIIEPPKTAFIIPNDQNLNAYPNGPIKILPHLYLGSERNTLDLNSLKRLSVNAILNVAAEVTYPEEYMFQSTMGYYKLSWEHNQDNLSIELQKAINIIDKTRSAGQNILVHCQCGVARSATVIIAYMMKVKRLSLQDAYEQVKALSPAISPNLGLLFQLREYEQWIKKKQDKNTRKYNAFAVKTSAIWKHKAARSLFYK